MRDAGDAYEHVGRTAKASQQMTVHCAPAYSIFLVVPNVRSEAKIKQEGLAVASVARDDPSTLPGDDPFPRARMHRDRNAR